MKHLNEYIVEVLSGKLYTFVKTLKYDFRDANGDYEKYFVDMFNNASEQYHAKLDKQSNIIISDKGNDSMIISLFVGKEKVIGTPDMKSLTTYGLEDDYFKPYKKYYLCTTINGVESLLVPAHNLYELVLEQEVKIIASKDRTNISDDVEKLTNRVKVISPNDKTYDISKVYDEDFVSPDDLHKKYDVK